MRSRKRRDAGNTTKGRKQRKIGAPRRGVAASRYFPHKWHQAGAAALNLRAEKTAAGGRRDANEPDRFNLLRVWQKC